MELLEEARCQGELILAVQLDAGTTRQLNIQGDRSIETTIDRSSRNHRLHQTKRRRLVGGTSGSSLVTLMTPMGQGAVTNVDLFGELGH